MGANLRKYGLATTLLLPLIKRGAIDFEPGATFVAGDSKIIKDEGAPANTTNSPVNEGNGIYSLALTATELQASRIVVTVIDAATKVWEDQAILIETYGNGAAQHAFDLDTAQQQVTVASMLADVLTSAALSQGAAQEIADELLQRAIANVEPSAGFRTLYGAIASLVNRAKINASGNLEVYKTDDATLLETLTATTNAQQDPIAELDPP